MKDVKKNMKIISRNVTKDCMIDYFVSKGTDAIVRKAIDYIPNPTAQTAVRVAGFAAYLYIAMKLTTEERNNIEAAFLDMFSGNKEVEVTDELLDELNQKLMEDAVKTKGQDA